MNWQTICDPMFSGRLCMTLVHSLWQVTLFAAIAWAFDRLGHRRSVRGSYAVHVAALLAGLAAMPVTYALVDVAAPGAVAQSAPTVDVVAPEMPPVLVKSEVPRLLADLPEQVPTAGSQPPGQDAVASAAVATVVEGPSARWARVAPWIVVLYALGVSLMLVRLLRGMWHAHQLASRAEPIVDGPLAERLRTLAHGWSMRVVPVLARAEEIVVPKVVGLLRPAILLPVSAIAGLSPDELEMILAHELAHVRRHDMWVNLVQRLAEVVLFFNPALWYLSRRTSTLREYCCDELTCRATSGSDAQLRARYASALLRIVELSKPAAARRRHARAVETGDLAALAAAGRSPSDLRRRVARLFGEPLPEPVRLSRGGLLTLVVLAAVLLTAPTAWRSAARSEPAPATDSGRAEPGKGEAETPDAKVLRGTVLDESGQGIAGADVWLSVYCKSDHSGPRVEHVTSDAQGRFTLEVSQAWVAEKAEWPPVSLWAYAPGHQLGVRHAEPATEFSFGDDSSNVAIALKRATDTSFTVLDPAGIPVAGALVQPYSVTFQATPGEVLRRIEARTDAAGQARLPAAGREALSDVRITAEGHGIQSQRCSVDRQLPAANTIRLRAVGRIEGQLIAEKPEWTKGVRMGLATHDLDSAPQGSTVGVAEVETDEQGRFVVPQIAKGRLHFQLVHVDESLPVRPQLPQSVDVKPGATTELRIPMVPLVTVRGSVRVEGTDLPVSDARIHIKYGAANQMTTCVSDAWGGFTAKVLPGRIGLSAFDTSRRYVHFDHTVFHEVPNRTDEFTLPPVELVPAKNVLGFVVDQRNQPVANLKVSFVMGGYSYGYGESNAGGRFEVPGVPVTPRLVGASYVVQGPAPLREPLRSSVIKTDPLTIEVQTPVPAEPPRALTPGDSPSTSGSASGNGVQPSATQGNLAVVVARHVMLLDGKEIITWAELEKRIAALPDPSLAHPSFYTTRGAHEAGLYPGAKDNIWRLHQQFKLKGHSEGSLWPSADLRYDRIKTAADLVPDESLRVEGRVVDGKGEPVADAEVLLVTPVDESIPYKSHNIVLVEGRVRNPLEHIVTRSDAKGQFAVYPPKDVDFYVVALHPTAGFNLAQKKPLSDGGKVQLLPWATLTSRFEEVAGERQEASLGTQVREQNGLPEIIFNQYWSDQGRKSPTDEFRFTHVPPIFPTTLDRDFPSEQGGSIGLPGATVSLLPGESRRLDLGPLSDKQREQLEWMRKKSAQQRENRPAEPKPAPSPATDGGKQAEPPVNDPAGKPAAKDAALDAEKRESAQLAIDVSILGVDGKPIDQHSVVTIWERVKAAADVGPRDHGWTDPRDGTIWRPVCGSISGETGPTRNGKDRFLTRNPLPPGVYRVTAFVGSRNEKITGMAVSEPIRLDGSRKTTPVAISIENGPPATFTILDAKTDKPIDYPRPGIRLTRSDGLVVEWDPLNPNLFPGNDGKYRIEHLSPGSYRVDVSARTYAYGYSDYAQEKPMAIDFREGEANDVVAKLHAQPVDEAEAKKRWPWAVEGTVADDEGRPLEGVEIRAATGYGTLRSTLPVVTDARGRYLLRFGPGMTAKNEKTGKWGADVQCASIFAHKTGYAEKNLGRQGGLLMADEMPDDKSDWDRKKIILPDKPYHLDFTMAPAAVIQGRLVDEKGEPLAKIGVLLNGTALPPSSSIAGSATTDAEGRFRFDRVTPGFAWWLELGDVKDLASSRTQPITLEKGETYDVDLRIVSQEGVGKMPRIVGIKDARGRDVLGKVIGDE